MQNGAVDYLIKPVDEAALKNAVMSVNKGSILDGYDGLFKAREDKKYCVLTLKCQKAGDIEKIRQFITGQGYNIVKYNEYLCLIYELNGGPPVDVSEVSEDLVARVVNELEIPIVGALGKIYEGPVNIITSYRDSETALQYSYFTDENRLFTERDKKYFQRKTNLKFFDLLASLTGDVNALNEEKAHTGFLEIAEIIKNEAGGIKDVAMMRIYSVIDRIGHVISREIFDNMYDTKNVLEVLKYSESYSEVTRYVCDMITEFISQAKGNKRISDDFEIRKIKNYILENLADNVTLENVSKVAFMNMYYFSVYFKKHTGVNFKEYVTQLRMEKAMSYVKETNMKISEISDAVGFSSQKHFSKAFKKYFGVNARDIRKDL
jgi:two-component system response regulator YesN